MLKSLLVLSSAFFLVSVSNAAVPSAKSLRTRLETDIKARSSTSFAGIIKKWEKKHGSVAVASLLEIANDRKTEDTDRYIAVMGAAKLGGPDTAQLIAPLLNDRSWMIRSAALRTLTVLNNRKAAKAVLPLLKDPALVVRSEAVQAVEKLQPEGAVEGLISAIQTSSNYRNGKALWVPQKILSALVTLKAKSVAPRLKPLLKHSKDPELQRQTIETLEALLDTKLEQGQPLANQIKAWELKLNRL